MFDVGFPEVVLIFVIGLLVLGPERLPRVATQIGRWVGRARRTASQLRHQLEREIALNDIRRPPGKKPESKGSTSGAAPQGGSDDGPAESQPSTGNTDTDTDTDTGTADSGAAAPVGDKPSPDKVSVDQ